MVSAREMIGTKQTGQRSLIVASTRTRRTRITGPWRSPSPSRAPPRTCVCVCGWREHERHVTERPISLPRSPPVCGWRENDWQVTESLICDTRVNAVTSTGHPAFEHPMPRATAYRTSEYIMEDNSSQNRGVGALKPLHDPHLNGGWPRSRTAV